MVQATSRCQRRRSKPLGPKAHQETEAQTEPRELLLSELLKGMIDLLRLFEESNTKKDVIIALNGRWLIYDGGRITAAHWKDNWVLL